MADSPPSSALSPERYLAWLYSPPDQQPVLAALCQIEAEIAGSLKPGIDHHVAHARLQWWREECERTAQGRPVHPLTRELARAFGGAQGDVGLPSSIAGIAGFVDTAVWDLAGATFESRKELTAYCERWAVAMFETGAKGGAKGARADASYVTRVASVAAGVESADARAVAGRADQGAGVESADARAAAGRADQGAGLESAGGPVAPASSSQAGGAALAGAAAAVHTAQNLSRLRALGAAVREVELLAGLAREAHAGRLRVPLDELERAGVDVGCLAQPPWPATLVALLRERHAKLRATIAEGVSQFGRDEQAPIRGLLVWATLAWRLSWRAQRALPNVILPRRYHALSDGWYAWRAARRATAGKLRLN